MCSFEHYLSTKFKFVSDINAVMKNWRWKWLFCLREIAGTSLVTFDVIHKLSEWAFFNLIQHTRQLCNTLSSQSWAIDENLKGTFARLSVTGTTVHSEMFFPKFCLILKEWFLTRFPLNFQERFFMSSASPEFVFCGPKIKQFCFKQ